MTSRSSIQMFLLAARKVPKLNRQAEYLMTTDLSTFSEPSGGDGYAGKLRGKNRKGTEFTLYDDGISPKKNDQKHSKADRQLRSELAAIVYVSDDHDGIVDLSLNRRTRMFLDFEINDSLASFYPSPA